MKLKEKLAEDHVNDLRNGIVPMGEEFAENEVTEAYAAGFNAAKALIRENIEKEAKIMLSYGANDPRDATYDGCIDIVKEAGENVWVDFPEPVK